MQRILPTLTVIWISAVLVSGCTGSKSRIFGEDMPTMKTIHNNKFNQAEELTIKKQSRAVAEDLTNNRGDFSWLPNPILSMYIFQHFTDAGHPVPGYTTYFKFYTNHPMAEFGEQAGWE